MWWGLLLFCLSLFLSAMPAVAEDDEPGRLPVRESPVVIGGDHNYPPYEFLDENGDPAGFNVELSRAIAEVMGMEIEIRLGPWDEMRRGLADGTIDILQGMAFTRERTSEVDFSIPHAKVHQSIWVRNGSPIKRLRDLANKRVIVMRGAVMHDFMLDRPELNAELVPVETLEDALRLLAEGECDAALVAKLPGEYLIHKAGLDNIHPIARPLVAQDYGYAVKKGNRDLLAKINEGLALLKKSGRYRQIYERWLGVLPEPGVPWERIVRLGALVVGPLLAVLILTVIWSSTLKRQVALRTEDLKREIAEKEEALRRLKVHQQQLIQADKMASLGVLVSGVAHEVNNPNGLILLNLPILKKVWADVAARLDEHYRQTGDFRLGWLNYSRMRDEIPQMLNEMQQAAGRIKRIVEDLKDFARRDDAELNEDVDLNEVAQAAVRLVENTLKKATSRFQIELADGLPTFRGKAQRIEQVVVNLLLNACQALTSHDQAVTLRTWRDGDHLVLEVADEGRGIDPQHLPKLTDPFFTTRRESGGTGLGLSVSAGIVEEHGGRLEFTSRLGEGTRVRLYLPQERPGDE
ncbi:transporter substrate-binding domain-containing protein [Geothermobacter ehrlichii]|uniref:transporter substrate-binding domain-containing protein n=1 Tax=Geothermobacter ehrlichii TaxID=213224 RepID=UPI001FE25B01|nr:transporter substrate-binding domain-containing protein [Geothermobacter ehrlichii]